MIRRPSWDYTHLYASMYNAMERMEPDTIGERSHHVLTPKFVRKFKITKELARRVAKGEYNTKEYSLFTSSLRFMDQSFELQLIQTTINGMRYSYSLDELQERHFIDLLTKLLRTQSRRWWD